MKLAELSVKNFQFTLVLVLMAVVAGARAFLTIPRSEDPSFPIPIFTVVAAYPGASPTDVEALVVDPLERHVNELDDLKSVDARISDGLAVLRVEFDASSDMLGVSYQLCGSVRETGM